MIIGVFFGGRSCEHDISIITGLQVIKAARHKTVPIYIDNNGVWWSGKGFDSLSKIKEGRFDGYKVHLRPMDKHLYKNNKKMQSLDACIIACHGLNGEDGTLQGLLELSGIAYTGSNVMASAVGMDKEVMKKLFLHAQLPVLPYIAITKMQYSADIYGLIQKVKADLGFPVIVKPANLGSSIGINIADTWDSLFSALRVAFEWDNKVLVEKALVDFIEVNCGVLGKTGDIIPSEVEQPVGWKDFLTFKDKYVLDLKSSKRFLPAHIDDKMRENVQNYAIKAFEAIGACGVCRVDFLIDKDSGIFLNEINTIPGSLANYLFSFDHIMFDELIDKLIEIAFYEYESKNKLKRVYDSELTKGKE